MSGRPQTPFVYVKSYKFICTFKQKVAEQLRRNVNARKRTHFLCSKFYLLSLLQILSNPEQPTKTPLTHKWNFSGFFAPNFIEPKATHKNSFNPQMKFFCFLWLKFHRIQNNPKNRLAHKWNFSAFFASKFIEPKATQKKSFSPQMNFFCFLCLKFYRTQRNPQKIV